MPPSSEDEFDTFQDTFDDIDWNAVPGLADDVPTSSACRLSPIREATEEPQAAPLPAAARASTASSPYSFDDLDDTFFAEVDALEQRLTQEGPGQPEPGPSSLGKYAPDTQASYLRRYHSESSVCTAGASQTPPALPTVPPEKLTASRFFQDKPLAAPEQYKPKSPVVSPKAVRVPAAGPETLSRRGSPRKRLRTESVTPTQRSSSKKQKGKQKESPSAGVRRILNDFEEDMTCPICCDILAVAHLGNPCGHTYCGDCGWEWIKKNSRAPTCAICRASLSPQAPMIPNFAMDNTIERHVQALAASGDRDWQEGGSKLLEWQQRKSKWKADAASRAAAPMSASKAAAPGSRGRVPRPLERDLSGSFIVPDDEDDEDYSESDETDSADGNEGGHPEVAVAVARAAGASAAAAPVASTARGRTRGRWNRGAHGSGSGSGGNARGGRGHRGNRGGRGWRGRGRGNQGRGGA